MATSSDSEGSDISFDNSSDEEEIDLEINREVDINEDYWLRQIFRDSDSEEDFEGFQNEWVTTPGDFRDRVTPDCTLVGGSAVQHPDEAGPIHYFELLWGQDIWDKLVTETNRYAEQERLKNPPPLRAPRWTPVDTGKMKSFIALCFAMGILRLPARHDYWRQSKFLFSTSFNKIMSRDQFDLIWRYLHLHNNEEVPAAGVTPDKLLKVRWYIEYLNKTFSENFIPYGSATIDESMIKFKGRVGFRQYLPAKPVKWGIKLWTLADSTTGYMHKFQVYTGKEGGQQEKGLAYRVVMDLCSHFLGSNMKVYFDNYYTGVDLLQDLHTRGVYACGTVRSNRKGLPTNLLPKNVKLDKHEYKIAQKDELTYCVWQDTKPVCVLSNFHSPKETGNVNRRSGHREQRQVPVPQLLSDYQKNMKGVDLCDQMITYYLLNHRSKKWWRRLFFYLMLVSAHNAYVIAHDSNPEYSKSEWPNFQDFIEDLVIGLIGNQRSQKAPAIVPEPARPTAQHKIEKLYDKNKTCHECSLTTTGGQRRGVTKFGCRQCKVPVHLQCQSKHFVRCLNS